MRIRKGHRCLPLTPADSSLTLQQARWSHGAKGEAAMVAVGDMIGPQSQRAQADTSMERKGGLEYVLEKNRDPVDGKFHEFSGRMNRATGVVAPTVTKLAETPVKGERSLCTRRPPRCKTWISGITASATETRDQPNSQEQSLSHVCAGPGMSAISAHSAAAQIIEQGLLGLREGGPGPTEQVTKSFPNSSKFVESEEPGRHVLQVHKFPETKSLIMEDSGISDVPSSEDVEVAKQLQNLHSFSHGSGAGAWSEAQPNARHARKRKAESEFDRESEYDDDMAENENSSVGFLSREVMHTDEDVSESRCKRGDGKKWRCCNPAEDGDSLCRHHRRLALSRRKKGSQFYPVRSAPAERSPAVYVANSRVLADVDNIGAASCWSPFRDEELAHDEHRQFLKAKSMKSLLSMPRRRFSHIQRGGI